MTPITDFLRRMGSLHDCVVNKLTWIPESRVLRFEIEDLFANFQDLPEYRGPRPGHIELREVIEISLEIRSKEMRLNVYEFVARRVKPSGFLARVSFWPEGRITARFRRADFVDVRLD